MSKLTDVLLLLGSLALFIIGVHQTIIAGIQHSYWIFMFSVCLLLLHRYRRQKSDDKSS